MTTPLNTVGASPLGAFVQSLLGARGIDAGVLDALLVVLDTDGNVYGLDPDDLSVLYGPVDLDGVLSNGTLEFTADGPTFFARNGSQEHAAFDADGVELWSVGPGAGSVLTYLNYIALIGEVLYRFTEQTAPTIVLEARNATTGALIDSVAFGSASPSLVNFPIGLVAESGELFALVVSEADPGPGDDYDLLRINPATLATIGTLSLGTYEAPDSRPTSLGSGPGVLHVGWATTANPQFATSYDLSLTAAPALDYPDPFIAGGPGLQSDDTPVVFYRPPTETSKVSRRTFAGTETHLSAALSAAVTGVLHRVSTMVVQVQAVADEAHNETGAGYERQVHLTQRWQPTTWLLIDGPSGAAVSASGLVTVPSLSLSAGVYDLAVRATGLSGEDEEAWQITVTVSMVAPTIDPLADHSHDSSSGAYGNVVQLTAGDEPIEWSFVSGNPSGMTIGPLLGTIGQINWPTPVAGVYTITYRCRNAAGDDTDTFELTVT